MKIPVVLLFFLLSLNPALPQDVTGWKIYTSMQSVNDIESGNDGIWAATTGGAFYYDWLGGDYLQLHKTDGLTGTVLNTTSIDRDGKAWFGSSLGVIDIYNPADNSVKTILDIFNSEYNNKNINEINAISDTILVSTGFGLSLINSTNFSFYETIIKFGGLPSNTNINSAAKIASLMYVCTNQGIAIQKEGASNLSAPESWQVYTISNGLPSDEVRKVIQFRDSVIAATGAGLSFFNGSSWNTFISAYSGNNIKDIVAAGDTLFFIAGSSLIKYSNGTLTTLYSGSLIQNKISYSDLAGVVTASNSGIFDADSTFGNLFFFPNGPAKNQFPDLTVDQNGTLWSASGKDNSGAGIYIFDRSEWSVINAAEYPELKNNDYYRIYAAPDNTIYAGNWGQGFLRIKGDQIIRFHTGNTDLAGISDNPDFLVITGFCLDSRNNLWVLNFGSVEREQLNLLTPDSTWYLYNNPAGSNLYLTELFDLVCDKFDTKWYFSNDETRSGLFYFNENHTYEDTGDDVYGYLSESNGLNSNLINALEVDNRGDIWVGSSAGVNIISNTSSILNPSFSDLRISSVFSLREQVVNAIAVDPLNRKWVGTNQGLFLLNSDGTSLLAALDSRNSPLVSDIITSIAVDKSTGTVYAGSDNGLVSFHTPAIEPAETFSELFIYPNPFRIDSENDFITIEGLIRDTKVKVLTITGKLVNEFFTPGGRIAVWDGKNLKGELVSSGVYLIVAYDEEGNNVITGKVAVLRE